MPPDDQITIIATRILVEAQQALKELDTFRSKTEFIGKLTARVMKQVGGDWKVAAAIVTRFAEVFEMTSKEVAKHLKIVAKETAEHTKNLARLNAEQIKVAASGDLLSRKLLAQQKAFDVSPNKPLIPQVSLPAFVRSNFGDINAYIAQSQNKIEAWKRVVVASAKQAGISFEAAGAQLKKMVSGTTVAPLSTALKQLGNDGRSSFQKLVDGAHLARIAFGALVSMLLFQAIQAVTGFFKSASDQAKQLEETMYRLANAERILSIAGQEISLKGLEDGITRIQKLLPIFAREDIAQLMGAIALGTQQLGYTEKQMIDLAQAVGLLNIQSTKGEDLMTTWSHVLTSLLGKSSTGVAQLGVSFNETEKAAAANTLGLLENGRTLQDLTDDELAAVKLAILLKNANVDNAESMALLNDFLDSNSSKLQKNASAWKDLLTTAGQFFNNVIPKLDKFLSSWQMAIEEQNVRRLFDQSVLTTGDKKFDMLDQRISNKLFLGIELTNEEVEKLRENLSKLDDKEILKLFPDPSAIKNESVRALVESLVEVKDTATGMPDPLVPDPLDEEALKALEELDDKLRDIAIDAQHAREDLEILLSQKQADLEIKFTEKQQDIDTEYIRKEEDAAVDLQRKIDDIERDAVRDRQEVLDKAREDEQNAEEDHQLKLWELKMRYLMDLEDALHARDARQIIRLQRQYELDKELLEKKKEQEDQERQDSLEADLADVEAKRQERLQDAQIEYEQKLADLIVAKTRELEQLNVWKARELADLDLWHQRELDEIDRQTQQKIERLLAGYIEEGKLHAEQQEAIHQILKKYFGENKQLVDDLVAYTNNAFAGMAGTMQAVFVQAGSLLATLGAEVGSIAVNPFTGNSGLLSYDQMLQNQGGGSGGNRRAEGGTVLATRPTTAVFGERGAELATFTPLTRTGRDVNKLFGDIGGGGGGEGTINLDILLSPDLEARIVENSMDGVANVLARINRSKV